MKKICVALGTMLGVLAVAILSFVFGVMTVDAVELYADCGEDVDL